MTGDGRHATSLPMADMIIDDDDTVLVTGAGGFIGQRVVRALVRLGFRNIRCLVRSPDSAVKLKPLAEAHADLKIEILMGNLLSRRVCDDAAKGATVAFHLAAGRGEKAFAQAYMDSVVTTRNLMDSLAGTGALRRFVNVSSLSVYASADLKRGGTLDETCEIERRPERRADPYTFAKVSQEEIVGDYAERLGIKCVTLRPGIVFGPGNKGIHGRVGISTFGVFLHLGGTNRLPLTYVDNCADAIVLAGVMPGIDGHAFNIVDDDLPTSRQFLGHYKRDVRSFRSIYVPYALWYAFCCAWEWYSVRSAGQLPPTFNRRMCAAYWKSQRYSNAKLKTLVGWRPRFGMADALDAYFTNEKARVGTPC